MQHHTECLHTRHWLSSTSGSFWHSCAWLLYSYPNSHSVSTSWHGHGFDSVFCQIRHISIGHMLGKRHRLSAANLPQQDAVSADPHIVKVVAVEA